KLAGAGLLLEGDALREAADGRALELTLAEGVTERQIRLALGEGGDLYSVPQLETIVPDESVAADRATVRLYDVSSLAAPRDLRARMLTALAGLGLARDDYAIEKCALKDGASAGGGPAELEFVLDKRIQAELLAIELERSGAPRVEVVPAGTEGREFTLRAERDALEQLQKELPAGATLQSVAVATFDGLTVEAVLANEMAEQDVRAVLERQGMPQVHVILEDVASTAFRLNLSYEAVRRKLGSIFADLAQRRGGISFQALGTPEEGREAVRVNMKLREPMSFADIKHYLRVADIGPYAEEIVVGQEDLALGTLVRELTLSLPKEKAAQIQQKIEASFGEARPVQKIVKIGATVAEEMRGRALLAVVLASVIIVLYVAMRFHAFRFGVAAIIALAHDILITAGLMALADWSGLLGDVKISLATLAAFLTILGYSLNDTIVVFDRIRENMASLGRKTVSAELIDLSINQTLSRTILTSLTTLVVVVVLYLLGGSV
ncbi:MAG: hypothetical protein KAX19_10915, partial [Candidatus Brocadiae bacterium]|nr:hypothetical protein [Candidatus Brocadiia bacterium]